jgi:hypothetical protein
MMQVHLRPCPACSRHARVSETACPFCGAAFSDAFRGTARPEGPTTRLTRAALFAFGAAGTVGGGAAGVAALSTTTTACSSSSEPGYGGVAPPDDASPGIDTGTPVVDDGSVGTVTPLYGASAILDGGDGGVAIPIYGAPFTTDASDDGPVATPAYGAPVTGVDAGAMHDDAGHTAIPLYGAVAIHDE